MTTFKFILYTLGNSGKSLIAKKNLDRLLTKHLEDRFSLEVVDLYDDIQIAEEKQIWATPMLERIFPEPAVRIIGDMSDESSIIQSLDIP